MTLKELKKEMENRIEGNILIAEFMGLKHPPNIFEYNISCGWDGLTLSGNRWYIKEGKDIYFDTALEYHSNWSWIMEVVEKIGTELKYSFYLSNDSGTWQIMIDVSNTNVVSNDIKKGVWDAIVHFIKWFNQHHTGSEE